MPRLARTAILATAVAGAFVAPAQAAVTRTVLGTGNDVAAPPNVPVSDGSPDGNAAVAWLQRDGGINHVFVSRLINGAWTPAARVDTGLGAASGPPAIGVGDGGRLTVAFTNGGAGLERLYIVTAPGTAAPISAPTDIYATVAGWKGSIDLDVGTTGDGYLAAHVQTNVHAFRIASGVATHVNGPTFTTLDAAGDGDASGNAPKQASVGVDATGATATIAWSEQDAGGNDHAYARRIKGTATADVGPAVAAEIPSLSGAPAVTLGNDELAVAVGGSTTWVAFRQNFQYGLANKARSLVRSFDGTTYGPAQVIDAVPLNPADVTDGAENPLIAVDANGHGVAVSSGQVLDNFSHVAKLEGTTWSRGTIVPDTGVLPRVAMTAAGTGLTLLTPGGTSPDVFSGRIARGPLDGNTVTVNDPTQGSLGGNTATGMGTFGDSAVVLYRHGVAANSKITVATFPLPPVPTPTPTPAPTTAPTPTPAAGTGTTPITPKFSKLRLSQKTIKRADTKSAVITGKAKGSYLELAIDRSARITIWAERALPGRKNAKGTCAKPAKGNAKGKRCTRYVVDSGKSLILDRPNGTTRIRFTGRLGGKRALAKGSYRLSITAADQATGALTPVQRLPFTLR